VSEAQAIFCRRRHQPIRPTLAKIRPGLLVPKGKSVLALPGQHASSSSAINGRAAFRRRAYDGDAPKRQGHRKLLLDQADQHRRRDRAVPKENVAAVTVVAAVTPEKLSVKLAGPIVKGLNCPPVIEALAFVKLPPEGSII
jgi:hypothetical protein